MKKVILIATLLFTVWVSIIPCFAREVPFTQEDRDRLIRLEIKVEEGQKRLEDGLKYTNKRMDDINKRVDDLRGGISDLKNFNYVILAAIVSLVGFVLWDRRTALAPAVRKNKELEEREERIERALKEYAMKEPKLAEILKNLGMM